MRAPAVIILALITSQLVLLQAAGQSLEGGARAVAMGSATSALAQDTWGHGNPATFSSISSTTISFFTSQAFNLPELRLAAFTFIQPTKIGTFVPHARVFGYDAFRDTHLDITYAKSFFPGTSRPFSLGLTARYHLITTHEFGSAGTFVFSLGWLAPVFRGLDVGFHIDNLTASSFPSGEEISRSFAGGIAFHASPYLLILADIYKDIRFPLSIRGGTEVRLVEPLSLRAGVTTDPVRFTAGAGVNLGKFHTDFAAEHNQYLGWSPALSISIGW